MVVKSSGFACEELFQLMAEVLKSDGDQLRKQLKGVFRFEVKNSEGQSATWTVDMKSDSGGVEKDDKKKADVTLVLSDRDLIDVMNGVMDPQKAFFQGRLKVRGNMALAMRLKSFQTQLAKYRSKL